MPSKIFVVILRYLVPPEIIDEKRPAHVIFLDRYYQEGVFFASGAQTPRTGGVILARAQNRESLLHILHQDPFHQEGCAEYQIFEFTPTKYSETFKQTWNF